MKSSCFTSATCPECQTYFDHVPVDGDGLDRYALLPVTPCTDCGAMLCSCCAQFACDACSHKVCLSHLTVMDDLRCCAECAAAFLAQDADALPQVETPGCVGCERPVTIADSRTSDIFGTWHTACLNAATEAARAYQTERDEAEGVTFHELPTLVAPVIASRPMGAASGTPLEAGSTEAA